MSHTQGATKDGPRDARIIEEHRITGPHGEDEIEGTDDRGRRWYHPRPEPRRRTDLMGFNSKWWMAVGWFALLLVVLFPFPWWW
jgi:hypothetical protein